MNFNFCPKEKTSEYSFEECLKRYPLLLSDYYNDELVGEYTPDGGNINICPLSDAGHSQEIFERDFMCSGEIVERSLNYESDLFFTNCSKQVNTSKIATIHKPHSESNNCKISSESLLSNDMLNFGTQNELPEARPEKQTE